jgi:glucose-1-phosphate thymidylyltransferase
LAKENLKIIIPMAGFGTRLRPHTWSKPKPLVNVAGKTVLSHVLDLLSTAADLESCEVVFIVGYLGEQVREYMGEKYPQVKTYYYVQEEMRGQSHAIALAREHLEGPTLILFVDTIVDEKMSSLMEGDEEAIIWVKRVEDPRRFGVVEVGEDGYVRGMIEKPDTMENDLAVVGIYYFARGQDLMAAIDRQLTEDIRTKGEYFIADAMGIMLEDGLKLFPKVVDVWLDAGLPETVLSTNQYLLDHGRDNSAEILKREGVQIHPPVHIHPTVEITDSQIGPHVSIGSGCKVTGSKIANSILDVGAQVIDANLTESLIGARAKIEGVAGIINVGDDSEVKGSG